MGKVNKLLKKNKVISIMKKKEMATHSSVLIWKIPWTEESGGLQLTGSQRAGQDWVTEHITQKETK